MIQTVSCGICSGRARLALVSVIRRGARVVEGGGLENRLAGNCHGGSNPSLSAIATNSNLCAYHLIHLLPSPLVGEGWGEGKEPGV